MEMGTTESPATAEASPPSRTENDSPNPSQDLPAFKDDIGTVVTESASATGVVSQGDVGDALDLLSQESQKIPQNAKDVTPEITYQWLKDLHKRMNTLEKGNDDLDGIPEGSNDYMKHTRPEVRNCNWEQFKNRFSAAGDCYAIEVLQSSDDLDGEMEAEQWKRLSAKKKKEKSQVPRKPPRQLGHSRAKSRYLERVRINSAHILACLAKVTGEASWSEKPHTFLRPFKILIHFHEQMQKEYDLLQKEHTTQRDREPALNEVARNASQGNHKALEDMACYIDFIKEMVMAKHHAMQEADNSQSAKIRFTDLWSLFRSGELVMQRNEVNDDNEDKSSPRANTKGPKLWRVYWIHSDALSWEVDDLNSGESSQFRRDMELKEESVEVSAYYIDYDGDLYSAVPRHWKILYFPGEKDVTKLPIFPIRFAKDYQTTLEQLQNRGKIFQSIVSRKHPTLTYQGWSMIQDPAGDALEDHQGEELNVPRHIDSDVIVDFHEAFQSYPWWKPQFPKLIKGVYSPRALTDRFPIIQWAGQDRSKPSNRLYEIVVQVDDIETLEWNALLESDQFIADPDERPMDSGTGHIKQSLNSDDLALLPSRMFGYALRERAFYNLDIRFIKELPLMDDPFGNLRIDEDCKTQIQALVYHHFQKKKAQEVAATKNRDIMDQDFIRGKGRGLVMLLHGAPGVGKTATAEAVSYTEKKPLFHITCGDLGLAPKDVETSLTEIFRLANLWDCILLLDEAEIFLSPREKRDENLQRNTLVSIFLRTLEYYSGILFLTTNRVGALDEAVKSRVHLSLGYPHLAEEETLALFEMNLKRLERIENERHELLSDGHMIIEKDDILKFASEHFRNREQHFRWNGRQIRNAFQIASSLAHYQHKLKPHRGLYIGKEHFEEVEKATKKFDSFRQQTLGKTDDELAKDQSYRANTSLTTRSSQEPWPQSPPAMLGHGAGASFASQHSHMPGQRPLGSR